MRVKFDDHLPNTTYSHTVISDAVTLYQKNVARTERLQVDPIAVNKVMFTVCPFSVQQVCSNTQSVDIVLAKHSVT